MKDFEEERILIKEIEDVFDHNKNEVETLTMIKDIIDSRLRALNIDSVVVSEAELFCRDCKYDKADTYHDKMWCGDCRQKDRFKAK